MDTERLRSRSKVYTKYKPMLIDFDRKGLKEAWKDPFFVELRD